MNFKQKKAFFVSTFIKIVKRIFYLTKKSLLLMPRVEKYLAAIFLMVALALAFVRTSVFYKEHTHLVPGFGGTYKEAVIGELKYLNPVLASSDNDLSASRLIFSSLVEISGEDVLPSIAKNWEVSADRLMYKFNLRDDVFFHDGERLTSQDVAYTISLMKDPSYHSPYYEIWKDIEVENDDNSITFVLPKQYGAFLKYVDFGIVPVHLAPEELSKKVIGSGPYKFEKVSKKDNKITQLVLERNKNYFQGSPYINKIVLNYFVKNTFERGQQNNNLSAVSGLDYPLFPNAQNLSFPTGKQFGLILNTKKDTLKDLEVRKKILNGELLTVPLKLTLTIPDNELALTKANEIKNKFEIQGISTTVKPINSTALQTILEDKDFELMLYGFDFSRETDLYSFWHSSQLNKSNLSGYSDKALDILLEDARMADSLDLRSELRNKIFKILSEQGLAKFYDPVQYNFFLSNDIKGLDKVSGSMASDRYKNIKNWFIKEKRVRN